MLLTTIYHCSKLEIPILNQCRAIHYTVISILLQDGNEMKSNDWGEQGYTYIDADLSVFAVTFLKYCADPVHFITILCQCSLISFNKVLGCLILFSLELCRFVNMANNTLCLGSTYAIYGGIDDLPRF